MKKTSTTKTLGIFDPYLDTLGGGERYCLSLAEAMLKKGWKVDLFWQDETIKEKLIERFGLEIKPLGFVSYSPGKSLFERRKFEKKYDVLFYVSDGSIPFMFGKNNFLHFQVPFTNLSKKPVLNSIKLKNIRKIICNSDFTKGIIDSGLKADSLVVYPPVDITPLKPLKKENTILSVGRFSQLLQGKRQDVLIDAFKVLVDRHSINNWQLVLAGGSEIGGKEYVETLKNLAKGYNILIIENPPFAELLKLYGKAKIFWTASGFEVDEEKNPEKVEHFGMTTVEAMAAGCVPVVMAKGGQKEIVKEGENGFLWLAKEELVKKTLEIAGNGQLMKKLSENAILRSEAFSKEKFSEKIYQIFENERK
ncbi:glycosyltransferase [Candidatus Microgenomates bacterium]|jgi:glycosyltransferase involved in cell wall biosynthesis|nr:MAG: glycosyltransferase [Candidatus Microgenomates bacterium]